MRHSPTTAVFISLLILTTAPVSAQTQGAAIWDNVLGTLEKKHPRIFLKDDALQRLKAKAATDGTLRMYARDVVLEARKLLGTPVCVYNVRSPEPMLFTARKALNRILTLGLAFRWTRDERFARRGIHELITASRYGNWSFRGALNAAELSAAVGIGYDWFYEKLSANQRRLVERSLLQEGLEPTLESKWWMHCGHNWNAVCNGGSIVGALAVADVYPEVAAEVVENCVTFIPAATRNFAPDGAWLEGVGYWGYTTHYLTYALAALNSSLGHDFGLSKAEGLSATTQFPIAMTGPNGLVLNYADMATRGRRPPLMQLFYLCRLFPNDLAVASEHEALKNRRAMPEHVIFYVPPPAKPPAYPNRDLLYRGPVDIAVFRSAWKDPQALFVGIKGGHNEVNHGHLDLGNFEMDALGVRWSRDLGPEEYALPHYFGRKRFQYYRTRSISHSVPLIDGRDQETKGQARIVGFRAAEDDAKEPFCVVDLTRAYASSCIKAMRGLRLIGDRKAVLVQDEFELKKEGLVTWGMTTDARIKMRNGREAELSFRGKKLIARILAPESAVFSTESAEQKKPLQENKGVRRLLAKVKSGKGPVRMAVLLSPCWPDENTVESTRLRPIDKWKKE